MPKRPDEWMPFYIGDYLRKTMHLTTEQHGAYLLLIMACWVSGGLIPGDDRQLAAVARVQPPQWRKMRPGLEPFFQVNADGWRNKRVDEELTNAKALNEQRRNAGRASAKTRWQRKGNEKVTTVITEPPTEPPTKPPTKPQRNDAPFLPSSSLRSEDSEADASGGREPPADPVKLLWDRGIKLLGEKNRSLFGKYRQIYGNVVVLGALVETENEMPADPVAYFIACCDRRKGNGRNGDASAAHDRALDTLGRAALAAESEGYRSPFETPH